MNDSRINLSTITGRINAEAISLLEDNPEGIRWVDLASEIRKSDTNLHPKTINGCIWKLVEKFPDMVYKPSEGLFRLAKYKSTRDLEMPDDGVFIGSVKKAQTVDEYIAGVPTAAKVNFNQLRALVHKQLPNAEEVLSYGIVGYKIDEKRARVFISGWKDHVALYPIPKNESLRQQLKPYIKGKGTLWFTLGKTLPKALIEETLQALVNKKGCLTTC